MVCHHYHHITTKKHDCIFRPNRWIPIEGITANEKENSIIYMLCFFSGDSGDSGDKWSKLLFSFIKSCHHSNILKKRSGDSGDKNKERSNRHVF
jgi:hypothetical protein